MRHHSVIEDSREMILAELEVYRSDRADGPHPRPEKAEPYIRALRAIEAGALEVRVDHAVYRVVGEKRPRQYLITEESRERVIEMLMGYEKNPALAPDITRALAALEYGATVVFAGGEMYRVVVED